MALPLFAGTTSKEVIAPAAAPNPCLLSWFAGGSVGYLSELEEPMYNLHFGVTNSCWEFGGWKIGLFAEIGYAQTDEDYSPREREGNGNLDNIDRDFDLDEVGDVLQDLADLTGRHTSYDLDILPITLNVKVDRQLTGNLYAYFGGGLGMSEVSLDLDLGPFGKASDSDWVFAAQIFTGLGYSFTPNFELYGGVRWIYLDDADLSDKGESVTLDLDNQWLFELGARFKF